MAWDVVSGGLKKPTESPKSAGSWIGNTLGQLGTGLAGTIGNIQETVRGLNKSIIPINTLPEELQGKQEGPSESLVPFPTTKELRKEHNIPEPQDAVQSILNSVVADVPFIGAAALSGGISSLPALLGRSAVGGAGAEAAKQIGFGPLGQFVGSLGAQTIGPKAARGLKAAKAGWEGKTLRNIEKTGVTPYLEKVKKNSYATAEHGFKNVKSSGKGLKEAIKPVLSDSLKGLSSKAKEEVSNRIHELADKVVNDKIPLSEVISAKQDFNRWGWTRNSEEAPYFKRLAGSLSSYIQKEGAAHPKALEAYNKGEGLQQILGKSEEVRDLIRDTPDALKAVAGNNFLSQLFGFGKKVAFRGISPAYFFARSPDARKYYMQMFSDNPTAQRKALESFIPEAKRVEKEYKKTGPDWEIVSGSMK
jgi:hypothetical protein